MYSFELIVFVIAVALIFDFINGFHDAANSVATSIATNVLSPKWAVAWAAFFNFIAFLFFGTHVAMTIGKGIVVPAIVDPYMILAGLAGAITWNLITWFYGIPSSSSHALIGGFAGAAIAKAGPDAIIAAGFTKIAISIVLSPLIGFGLGFLIMKFAGLWEKKPKADKFFRSMQFVSAALYSLGHGANDAQKTMGIIAVLLFSAGYLGTGTDFDIPLWVILVCHAAMGLGTLAGGWRIIKTMSEKITKLRPSSGFSAEMAGTSILFSTAALGLPVSTTHTISGAIMGVGATGGLAAVNWQTVRHMLVAWILTIPAAGGVAAVLFWLGQ